MRQLETMVRSRPRGYYSHMFYRDLPIPKWAEPREWCDALDEVMRATGELGNEDNEDIPELIGTWYER